MSAIGFLKNKLNKFVSHGLSESQTEAEKVRVRFILYFYPLTAIFLVTLVFINIKIHHSLLASLAYLIMLVGFTLINFYLIASKNIKLVSTLTTLIALITASYLMFEGGFSNNGVFWFILFPIIAHILNSTKAATVWSMTALSGIMLIWLLDTVKVISLLYPSTTILETASAFLVATVFLAFYNSILEKSQTDLEQAIIDLEKFKLAVMFASDHIIITDKDSKILFANPAAAKITGYSLAEMIGQTPRLWGGKMDKVFYEKMWKIIGPENKKPFQGEIINRRKSGEMYEANVSISPVLDANKIILYYVGIEHDITREKEVDRMKTEFVSLASHQLRTPLTSIKWYLEMILDKSVGDLTKEQEKYLTDVYESNETMISLVNSLLNISRIESGKLNIKPEPTDLGKLFRDVVSKLQPQISEANLKIIDRIPSGLPKINTDPQLVSNVYTNLMTNSIKYTAPGGVIELKIENEKGTLISSVKDSGKGIPVSEQKHIFERFFRGSNVSTTSIGSTGLGLYLAKEIIEASGGKIWFESVVEKGSSFYFSLPLSGGHAQKGEMSLSN